MSNTTTARYVDFTAAPDAGGVYAIERSDGVIKVGCSRSVRRRLKSLSCEFNRQGLAHGRFLTAPGGRHAEQLLIAYATQFGCAIEGRIEYFNGVSLEDVRPIFMSLQAGLLTQLIGAEGAPAAPETSPQGA